MTERPMIFTDTVPALRAGRKTQTRRMRGLKQINAAPDAWELFSSEQGLFRFRNQGGEMLGIRCPYGVAGDRLWVREGWAVAEGFDPQPNDPVWYRADGEVPIEQRDGVGRWRNSMFMPRWAARDLLEIISVRPERVQDITEEDAQAEGAEILEMTQADIDNIQISDEHPDVKKFWKAMGPGKSSHRLEFQMLWSEINGAASWGNWAWRVEFKRLVG